MQGVAAEKEADPACLVISTRLWLVEASWHINNQHVPILGSAIEAPQNDLPSVP